MGRVTRKDLDTEIMQINEDLDKCGTGIRVSLLHSGAPKKYTVVRTETTKLGHHELQNALSSSETYKVLKGIKDGLDLSKYCSIH